MMEVLKWEGRRGNTFIRGENFSYAVGSRMTEEQASNLQTKILVGIYLDKV